MSFSSGSQAVCCWTHVKEYEATSLFRLSSSWPYSLLHLPEKSAPLLLFLLLLLLPLPLPVSSTFLSSRLLFVCSPPVSHFPLSPLFVFSFLPPSFLRRSTRRGLAKLDENADIRRHSWRRRITGVAKSFGCLLFRFAAQGVQITLKMNTLEQILRFTTLKFAERREIGSKILQIVVAELISGVVIRRCVC